MPSRGSRRVCRFESYGEDAKADKQSERRGRSPDLETPHLSASLPPHVSSRTPRSGDARTLLADSGEVTYCDTVISSNRHRVLFCVNVITSLNPGGRIICAR
jgi:hypothetical protein